MLPPCITDKYVTKEFPFIGFFMNETQTAAVHKTRVTWGRHPSCVDL